MAIDNKKYLKRPIQPSLNSKIVENKNINCIPCYINVVTTATW
jgi:hypothetical protein